MLKYIRLVPGYATMSYGNFCAKKSGIPASVIQRAEEIAEKRSRGEPITSISKQDAKYKEIVEAFLKLDLEKGDVQKFMKDVIFEE